MPSCSAIDPLVTSYIDGEIDPADRLSIDEHLRLCPPCHARVAAERAVRELCRERRALLNAAPAPRELRARCAGLVKQADAADRNGRRAEAAQSPSRAGDWRSRAMLFAAAAALVLVVAGVGLYQLTGRSNRVMAAELTADHMKCFALNTLLGTRQTPAAVASSMSSSFGWPAELPAEGAVAGLDLIGSRPCLYGEGRVAHVMYRHNGRPVSLFMLPKTVRTDELLQVLGHNAVIWSSEGRTFVLIAREGGSDVERLVEIVRASLR